MNRIHGYDGRTVIFLLGVKDRDDNGLHHEKYRLTSVTPWHDVIDSAGNM
ncbi:MAG: hypothetical protein L0Z73_01460 [Gammaproteobacteria bacterium]|nr:hypothetical protein [Gammaproteobacteria bacterium]